MNITFNFMTHTHGERIRNGASEEPMTRSVVASVATAVTAPLAALALLAACSGDAATESGPAGVPAAEEPVTLTVYSGRSESMVGPLFARLEGELGVDLEVQYGDTPDLVTRLMTEGAESPADLIFAQDSGHLGALSAAGALEPLPAELLEQVHPKYRDPDGNWVGTSGRLRVLVVNTATVPEAERPSSLKELADPRWKGRLGWAPTNGSFQAHVGALRAAWGEEETRAWLAGVKANEPQAFPKNSPQVEAAHAGEIDLGWVNHYYLHRLQAEGYRAANHRLAPGDAGNVVMVAGVGIRKGSPDTEAARELVAALLSPESQRVFAQDNFEYPTVPGVETHETVPPLDPEILADVPQQALADLGPTRTMLQELGLL